jgi:hypothetical protein
MPSLRLNIGLNGGRKLPFGGAAPSGIPISTTNLIINFGVGNPWNGAYSNKYSVEFPFNRWTDDFAGGDYGIWSPNGLFSNATWTFIDTDTGEKTDIPTNPSTNPNFIPTSGWSSSITITAA